MTLISSLVIHVLNERGRAYSIAIVKTGKAFDGENLIIIFLLVKVKVKAVCGSYSTAALRYIVLLPE